eukprot:TRINITY_DN2920_c0_g1_i1.p1 TRINITY_DN2920_c0_g1~~TRINITY_DN2920_c0_g1_i1.p1  ORF type:complete len:2017 (-),score=451.02 TRINITY_DN2920_c0_g1_i1:62-6112(-)
MPEDSHKSPAPPVVPGQQEPVEEWQTKARAIRGGGEAEGVQTERAEVVIKYKSINKLRKALRDGGGLTAKRGVGEFHRGFTILNGRDVTLAAFDIIGLQEGDEIDEELAPIVQDALKASLEDERDIVVIARPPWIQPRVAHPPSCCRRFWSRILCCCVSRQRRGWHRRSRSLDRARACITAIQGGLFKLCYGRAGTKKNRDVFLSYQDSDRDIAKWIKKICERRGMSLYTDTPIDCVHNAMVHAMAEAAAKKSQHQVQAVVAADHNHHGSDSDDKEHKDNEEGSKEGRNDKEDPKEEYMKHLLADPTAVQAPVESLEHWIQLREETIKTSKILIVVLSKESSEDAWILLDCLWAWQWGIPILPVKRPMGYQEASREKQDKEMHRIRRRLNFLYGARTGQPDAGQGANRQDFQTRIAQALTIAISGGRKHKKNNLPHGMTDALQRACRHLQKEANALENTRDSEAEQTLLKDSKLRALTHAERLTPVSKFNAIMAGEGEDIDVQEEVMEARELTPAPRSSMKAEEADDDDGEDGPDKEEKQRKLRLEQEQQAIEYAKSLQLAPSTSERVYGIIAMIATSGVLDSSLAERAMCAIRTITHTERGCRAVYKFGGIQAILILLKSAGLIPEEGVEVIASMVGHAGSAHGLGRFAHGQALDHEEERASFCARLFACCKRKAASNDDREEDASADVSPGGSPGSGSPSSGSPDGSPSGSPKGERTMTFELSRSLSNFGGLQSQNTLASLRSNLQAFEKRHSIQHASAPPPEGADLELYISDHCFSALRNLAAHSQDRKHEVFKHHGANSAVRALQVFLYDKEAEASSTSCAALLRNLSEGSKGCVRVLVDAGLLEIAETELKESLGGSNVRRHILAMLQNMAADLSASTHIFLDGKATKWLGMCADALEKSIEDKDHRLTRQALGAVANFSLLTAGQDLANNRRSAPDAGSQPDRSPAVMKKASDSREGLEGSDNEEDGLAGAAAAPDSAKSASAGSEGSGAKSAAISEGRKEEDQSKHDSAPSDKDGATSTAVDDKSSSNSSDESSDGENSGERSDDNSADEKQSNHEEDITEIGEEKQSEHGSWKPRSEQGSDSFAANDSQEDAELDKADLRSVSTAGEEVEASLERAMKKVSGDVVEGILRLVSVKRKARGILDDGSYDAEVAVAASAVAALSNFAQDTDVERFIGSMGGIDTVLKSMSTVGSEDFQLQAVRFFWNMTFSKSNQQQFVDSHGIESLIGMMEHFREPCLSHARLQEQACGVLRNLAVGKSGRHKRRLLKADMVRALALALEKFSTDVSVCTQASLALRAICEGAPPAAVQAANAGAVGSLVKVLKLTGSNFELTDNILQTLTCVLVSRDSLPPFAMAGGHLQSLEVLSRFFSEKTALAALQVMASALGHLHEPDDKLNKESLKYHGAGVEMSLVDQDQADGEEVDRELIKKQMEKLRTMPGTQMRKELLEQGIIPKIFDTMETFEKGMSVLEAAAGCLLNLVLEVHHYKRFDDKHAERKTDVGMKCDVFLRMLGKVSYDSGDKQTRDRATGLMATILRLLAAVTSQPAAANALYKEQAGERALEYMKSFIDEPRVQTAGCAFIGNFCAAKFKIRKAVVEVGAIRQISDLLETYREDESVVEAACMLLKYLCSTEGIAEETERAQAVPRCFDVMEHHRGHPKVMTACLGLFWSLALQDDFAEELLRQEIVHKTLNIMSTNIADAKVMAAGGGLLRNLFTTTSLGTQASMQCKDEGGFSVLLEGLFLHSLPPVDEDEVVANLPRARAGAVPIRSSQHGEGEAAGGALGRNSLLRQPSSMPQRQGSIIQRQGSIIQRQGSMPQRQGSMVQRQGSMPQRQGSMVQRQGSMPQRQGSMPQRQGSMPARQGSALMHQKSKLGGPNAKAAGAAAAYAQMQKPKRVAEWKATEDSTSVGENILAALRNLAQHTEIAKSLADEIQGNDEVHEIRLVIELHPNSAMLQYQGLDFLNQLLVVRRDIKPVVSGMSDHVMMMLNRHRRTPVSDIAELVLEAIT